MSTEGCEGAYMLSEDQLLDKAPMSASMIQHEDEALSTGCEAMETENSGEEELDLHVCGKCKAEFTNIQHYVEHKRVACSKRTPSKNQESPSKAKRVSESPAKQVITAGTDNVTAILEPQVQGFCETVIEEGGMVVEAQEEAQQEIIKAARALESQTLPEKRKRKATTANTQQEIDPNTDVPSTSTPGEPGAFKCNICYKDFASPENLVVHQFLHKKFHQCNECKRSFVTPENLTKHKKEFKHVFKCKICHDEFGSQEICKAHVATHTRQHECVDCKKKFFTDKALLRHRDKVLHNLPCDQCDKICRDKHALTKHQESHLRVKSHGCKWEGCERGFRSASELLKHEKCVHLGIKEHKCTECGREFARKDKLNRHILIHSPNRPTYPCPFKTFTGCVKTFYRKDKLQRHIFAHSKEKPYKCETCNKVFARKDNLTEHMRIHTGEFKHRCPVCNKGMGGPKKLLLHVQQKHSGINEVIPDKPTMVSESVLLATSQAATVTTTTTTTSTTTESADASAASWVQENITGDKTPEEAEVVKTVASPTSVSGMSEDYPAEQVEEGAEEGEQQMEGEELTSEDHNEVDEHSNAEVQQQHHQARLHHQILPEQETATQQIALQPLPTDQQVMEQQQTMEQQQHIMEQQHVMEQQQQSIEQHQEQLSPRQQVQQQLIIQPQTMIISPSQASSASEPRVSVHYLASTTTSQPRAPYAPNVTQSDTALLHEVLNELATRSLFNS